MISKTFVSYELDDMTEAARQLFEAVSAEDSLSGKKVGFLYCYSDTEVDVLVKELYSRLCFPIIGATAIAAMDEKNGFHEMGVTLMVLSAEDCDFSVALSEPITPENVEAEIAKTYNTAAAALNGEPKLVYAIPPYLLSIMLDSYTETFSKAAPNVPFIGGLPSFNGNNDTNATILNADIYTDRLVLLAISGNIRPVFTVKTVLDKHEIKKRRVTKAENNIIYNVDNLTFIEYLEEIGLINDINTDINQTVHLVSVPLIIEEAREEYGQNFRYLRALHYLDKENGSGTSIGKVPQGSYVSIHPLDRNEIGEAAEQGIRDLKSMMDANSQDGYKYSTVLGVSCIGRYVIMVPNNGVEVENLLGDFPEDMTLSGFYSYGEICPLPTPGGLISFAHNESLVLCAF